MDIVNELKKICPDNLLYKKEDIFVYAYDTSQNPDKIIMPLAVVFPKNTSEVSKIAKFAYKNNISLIPRAKTTDAITALTTQIKNIIR